MRMLLGPIRRREGKNVAHLSAKEGTSRWVYSSKLIMMIGPMLLVPNGYLDCCTAIPLAITIWMKFLSTSQKKKKICKILYHFIQILKFLVQMYLIFLTPQMNIFNKINLCASTINLIYDYYGFLVEFVVCFCVNFFFFSFPLCAWTKPLLNNGGQSPPNFFLIISIYSY